MAVLVLTWLAVAMVIIAFSLSNDLSHRTVRRASLIAGLLLPGLTALWAVVSEALRARDVLIAAAPLIFLLLHQLLKSAFRRWTGEAPIVVSPGATDTAGARFHEQGVIRRVTVMDYLFSLLLGVGMLLVVAAVLAVGSSGVTRPR